MPDKNVNTNTNNVNVNVNVEQPGAKIIPKKSDKPNWYTRTILGGIIALTLSICGYYLKKNMDDKPKVGTTIQPNNNLIKPN